MVKYTMKEMPDLRKTGETRKFPAISNVGTVDVNDLAEHIHQSTTYSPADIKGAVSALSYAIAKAVAQGYSVKLDGIGIFTASLGLRPNATPETTEADKRLNAQSVMIRGIRFRADKDFVSEANAHFAPQRSNAKRQKSSTDHTPQERLQMAKTFMAEHGVMTLSEYCTLTGILRPTAWRELNSWVKTPSTGIATKGKATHKTYVLKE